jgi:CTP:molybdopterin cytidylyltransferase MocA
MASIVLPTTEWTAGADDVVAALRPDDELLVVCDDEADPVREAAPDRATVIVAGEPEDCSGKANAVATGLERADQEVVVLTDDDVSRPDVDWVDRLVERARAHGAATEVPVFVGGRFWAPLEPAMALFGSVGVAHGGNVWGGGCAFDRSRLDEASVVRDLRRTVGDDNLLSEHVEDPWAYTDRPRQVPVDGSLSGVRDRLARFAKGALYFQPGPTLAMLITLVLFGAAAWLFPLASAGLATAAAALTYGWLGLRRWTVALAFASLLLLPVGLVAGAITPTFRWGGRRYRWRGAFDVDVR